MSGAGGLDIRLPIGALFTALGILLGGYGLATADTAGRYAPSFGVNVNLWWGGVMLVFGLLMLAVASRTRAVSSVRRAADTAEGRATEEREHDERLER